MGSAGPDQEFREIVQKPGSSKLFLPHPHQPLAFWETGASWLQDKLLHLQGTKEAETKFPFASYQVPTSHFSELSQRINVDSSLAMRKKSLPLFLD